MEFIFNFAMTGLIVVIALYAILKIVIKKFDPEKSKVGVFGVLQGMTNKEIISISSSIISYIFLIYLMVSFVDVELYVISIVMFLTILSGLLLKNKKVIINILLDVFALGGIKAIYLIHDYIINEYMSIWMLLLLVFVMIFIFLYLSYRLLRDLKTVVFANKFIRKGGKLEN